MNKKIQQLPVEVRRSRRRKKTISARVEAGKLIILAPHAITQAELQTFIAQFQERFAQRYQSSPNTDTELEQRAQTLNQKYFHGRLQWQSIRYVANQTQRLGSCNSLNGNIRLSDKLINMPHWVSDYVLMHELAHLEEANHGRAFWQLVYQYPLTERARGYLMAVGLEEETAT